jgi:glycerophosphoryl diester phosphodiesterase
LHPHSPLRRQLRTTLRHFLRLSTTLPLVAGFAIGLTGCGGNVAPPPPAVPPKPLVIGHRGASALRPEHTLAAYRKAIEDGADVIEPDLVVTKDGFLVARHENEISGTTNVSEVPQFASRRATKTIDGVQVTGWFTEDFTLTELKQLRARERIPANRPGNTQYNDQFEIPTLAEVIALAEEMSASTGRTIHIYPETKHPTYFKNIDLPFEDRLIQALRADDFTKSTATVFIQSFETANLKELRQKIGTSQPNWKLVQLIDAANKAPYDFVAAGDTRTYADLLTQASIQQIATYADGLGPYKLNLIDVETTNGTFKTPSEVIRYAHEAKLIVHSWTFRPEDPFLPASLRTAGGTASTRNEEGSITEIQKYLAEGLDGFFTDDPAVGRRAVNTFNP